MEFPVGSNVAGYRIERVLAADGTGTTYLAHHPSLPRHDALKVLSAELSQNHQFRARFLQDPQFAATLAHPGEGRVYGHGEIGDGRLWIAMDLGETPSAGRPFPPPIPQPQPTQRRGRLRWWAVAAAAILAAVAVVVGIKSVKPADTVHGSPAQPTTASGTPTMPTGPTGPVVPSANDTGAVRIITDDPSCSTWQAYSQAYTDQSPLNRWQAGRTDNPTHVPGNAWTPEQRAAMQQTGTLMRDLAAKTAGLVSITPHRVMRELYEQLIAYDRAYADSLDDYSPQRDLSLGRAGESALNALITICNAASDGAAVRVAALVKPPRTPLRIAAPADPANPKRFVGAADRAVCGEWIAISQRYDSDPVVAAYQQSDRQINVDAWTPQQKANADAVKPILGNLADQLERTAQAGDNAVLQDFAALSAQYGRGLAQALASYKATDHNLGDVADSARKLVGNGCDAAAA